MALRKTGNADHVHMWTESNPGRDAFRQRGRGRVSGNQLTEGPLIKTRGEGAVRTADEEGLKSWRGKEEQGLDSKRNSYFLTITRKQTMLMYTLATSIMCEIPSKFHLKLFIQTDSLY